MDHSPNPYTPPRLSCTLVAPNALPVPWDAHRRTLEAGREITRAWRATYGEVVRFRVEPIATGRARE